MLNTRYLIYSPDQAPIRNLHAWALPGSWKTLGARQRCGDPGLGGIRRTVVVDERFRGRLDDAKATADASADITLTEYRADRVTYRANSANGGVAVFSEITVRTRPGRPTWTVSLPTTCAATTCCACGPAGGRAYRGVPAGEPSLPPRVRPS